MTKELFNELTTSTMMLDRRGFTALSTMINGMKQFEDNDAQELTIDDLNVNGVLIIPLLGVLTKYGQLQDGGLDAVASLLQQAESADDIRGSILLINTPGGTSIAPHVLEETLKHISKPVVAVIDGLCCSCGYYVAALCDMIFCTHRMNEVGSIGVYCTVYDDTDALGKLGYRVFEVYPPESSYKNKEIRDIKADGNTQTLIDESLTPLAKSFQQVVRDHRTELDESVAGILEGRVFFAEDALKHGLIDGICSLSEVYSLIP